MHWHRHAIVSSYGKTFANYVVYVLLYEGGSLGLMVEVLDSKFKGCEFKTLGTVRFRSLGNFVYPNLP